MKFSENLQKKYSFIFFRKIIVKRDYVGRESTGPTSVVELRTRVSEILAPLTISVTTRTLLHGTHTPIPHSDASPCTRISGQTVVDLRISTSNDSRLW